MARPRGHHGRHGRIGGRIGDQHGPGRRTTEMRHVGHGLLRRMERQRTEADSGRSERERQAQHILREDGREPAEGRARQHHPVGRVQTAVPSHRHPARRPRRRQRPQGRPHVHGRERHAEGLLHERRHALNNTRYCSDAATNMGGWRDSGLRRWMNGGEVWDMFPEAFRTGVSAVLKQSNSMKYGFTSGSAASATSDRLWLVSYRELVPTIYDGWKDYGGFQALSQEGGQYEFFKGRVTNNYSSNTILADMYRTASGSWPAGLHGYYWWGVRPTRTASASPSSWTWTAAPATTTTTTCTTVSRSCLPSPSNPQPSCGRGSSPPAPNGRNAQHGSAGQQTHPGHRRIRLGRDVARHAHRLRGVHRGIRTDQRPRRTRGPLDRPAAAGRSPAHGPVRRPQLLRRRVPPVRARARLRYGKCHTVADVGSMTSRSPSALTSPSLISDSSIS